MFLPNKLVPTAPKPSQAFTRTAPLLPGPFDLYKLNQRVQKMQAEQIKAKETNSYLDIIFNKEALRRTSSGKFYENDFILRNIFGRMDMTFDLWSRQFNLAKPGKAILATLENLGESLDVVANLVKAPLQAYTSEGRITLGQALSKAYGTGNEGQKVVDFKDINENVDWIPKGFVFDLIGEILVDPVNWVTFGAYAAGKAALATGTKATLESTFQYMFKNVNKLIGTTIVNQLDDALKQTIKVSGKASSAVKTAASNVKITTIDPDTVVKHTTKAISGITSKKFANKTIEELTESGEINRIIKQVTEKIVKNRLIGSSPEVIETTVRYALAQPQVLRGLQELSVSNIGGYLHRLNVAAFRNDYNEFSKIILSSRENRVMYNDLLIKQIYQAEQFITKQKYVTRFMYAVDEVENALIKKMLLNTPIGLSRAAYVKYLKKPIKGYEYVLKDLEQSRVVMNILEEEGFSTKSFKELQGEYRDALKRLDDFIRYNKASENKAYDLELSNLKEHLDLATRRYEMAKYKEELGINTKELQSMKIKRDTLQKQIDLDTVQNKTIDPVIVKEKELLEQRIKYTENYDKFRELIRIAGTSFEELDYKTYDDYVKYKEVQNLLEHNIFKSLPPKLQLETIIKQAKENGIKLPVEIVEGTKLSKKEIEQLINEIAKLNKNRLSKIEAMMEILSLTYEGGYQASMVITTLKTPQHKKAFEQIQVLVGELQNVTTRIIKEKEEAIFKEIQQLDDFITYKTNLVHEEVERILESDESVALYLDKHKELAEAFTEYMRLKKQLKLEQDILESLENGQELQALIHSIMLEPGYTGTIEETQEIINDVLKGDTSTLNRRLDKLTKKIEAEKVQGKYITANKEYKNFLEGLSQEKKKSFQRFKELSLRIKSSKTSKAEMDLFKKEISDIIKVNPKFVLFGGQSTTNFIDVNKWVYTDHTHLLTIKKIRTKIMEHIQKIEALKKVKIVDTNKKMRTLYRNIDQRLLIKKLAEEELDKFSWAVLGSYYKEGTGLVLPDNITTKVKELYEYEYTLYKFRKTTFNLTDNGETINKYKEIQNVIYTVLTKPEEANNPLKLVETSIREAIRNMVITKKTASQMEESDQKYALLVERLKELIQGWAFINRSGEVVNPKVQVALTSEVYQTMQTIIKQSERLTLHKHGLLFKMNIEDIRKSFNLKLKEIKQTTIKGSEAQQKAIRNLYIETAKKATSEKLPISVVAASRLIENDLRDLTMIVSTNGVSLKDIQDYLKNPLGGAIVKAEIDKAIKEFVELLPNPDRVSGMLISDDFKAINKIVETVLNKDLSDRLLVLGGVDLLVKYKIRTLETLLSYRGLVTASDFDKGIPLELLYLKETLTLEYMRDLLVKKSKLFEKSAQMKKTLKTNIVDDINAILDFFKSTPDARELKTFLSPKGKKFLDAYNRVVENRYLEQVVKLEEIEALGYVRNYKALGLHDYQRSLFEQVQNIFHEVGLEYEYSNETISRFLNIFVQELVTQTQNNIYKMLEDFDFYIKTIRELDYTDAFKKHKEKLVRDFISPTEDIYDLRSTRTVLLKKGQTVPGEVVRTKDTSLGTEVTYRLTDEERYYRLKKILGSSIKDKNLEALWEAEIGNKSMKEILLVDNGSLVEAMIYRFEYEAIYTIIRNARTADMFHPDILTTFIKTFENDLIKRIFNATRMDKPLSKIDYDAMKRLLGESMQHSLLELQMPKNQKVLYNYLSLSMSKIMRQLKLEIDNAKKAFGPEIAFLTKEESKIGLTFAGSLFETLGDPLIFDDIYDDIFKIGYDLKDNDLGIAMRSSNVQYKNGKPIITRAEDTQAITLLDKEGNKRTRAYVDFETLKKDYSKDTVDFLENPAFQVSITYVKADGTEIRKNYFLKLPDGFNYDDKIQGRLHKITKEQYEQSLIDPKDLKKQMVNEGIVLDEESIIVAHNLNYDLQYLKEFGFTEDFITFDTLPFLRIVNERTAYQHELLRQNLELLQEIPVKDRKIYIDTLGKTDMTPKDLELLKNFEDLYGKEYLDKIKENLKNIEEASTQGYNLEDLSKRISPERMEKLKKNLKEFGFSEDIELSFHNSAYDVEVVYALTEEFFETQRKNYYSAQLKLEEFKETITSLNVELEKVQLQIEKISKKGFRAKGLEELKNSLKNQINEIEIQKSVLENSKSLNNVKTLGDLNSLGGFFIPEYAQRELQIAKAKIAKLGDLDLVDEETIEEILKFKIMETIETLTTTRNSKGLLDELLEIKTIEDYKKWITRYLKTQDEFTSVSKAINRQINKAELANQATMFTENREALESIEEIMIIIDQVKESMIEAQHIYMSSIYGNALGFKTINRTIANWKIKKAWGESANIDYIRRLLKFQSQTGDASLDFFAEYFRKGIKDAILEDSMKEILSTYKSQIKYDEQVLPLKEAVNKHIDRLKAGNYTQEEQELIFEYILRHKGNIKSAEAETILIRKIRENKFDDILTGSQDKNKLWDYLLTQTKEQGDLKKINKELQDFKTSHMSVDMKQLDDLNEVELRELYRSTFPDSAFVQLDNVVSLLDEDFKMQEKVYSIIKNMHLKNPEKLGPAFSRMTEVMHISDINFKYIVQNYFDRIKLEKHEDLVKEFKEQFTRDYFKNIMLTKYGKEVEVSEYGDALAVYMDHVHKMVDNLDKVDNKNFYRSVMNPDTSFTDYLYDVYKDNIQDAMDPLTIMKGKSAQETEEITVNALYEGLKKVIQDALSDVRAPLSEIKTYSETGEMFPIYIGHFKKYLNEMALQDNLKDQSKWILDLENLGEIGNHSKYVLQFTRKTKQAKEQTRIIGALLDDLRKPGSKLAGSRFVEYSSTDPGAQKFYHFLNEELGDAMRWITLNNVQRSTRQVRVEHLDNILNSHNIPEYFVNLKMKFKKIENELNYVYAKYKVIDIQENGLADPEQLKELMTRIKASYMQYLEERMPDEYVKAIKQLRESGFDMRMLKQDRYQAAKYIVTYMNNSFRDVYNGFESTKEFYNFLTKVENKDYALTYLVVDDTTGSGMRIVRFMPKSEMDLQKIIDSPMHQQLMFMDTQQFQIFEKYLRQNFKFQKDGLGDVIRRLVLMPIKSAMLLTANFMFNNIIDINLKNLVSQEGGMFSLDSVIKDTVVSAKWVNIHQTLKNEAKEALRWATFQNEYERVWIQAYREVLVERYKLLNQTIPEEIENKLKIAEFVQSFMKSPSASSEPVDMIERIKNNVVGHGKNQGEIEKFLKQVFYANQLSPFRYNLEMNSYFELIGRLALHINNLKKGLTMNESLLKILKTHFNYSSKSKGEMLAEFVIPFTSYPLRSMEFWPEALSYDNATLKFMVDGLINIWGRDTLENNDYALYQFSRGNVPMGNSIIQTGFTFMDSMTSPFVGKNTPLPIPEQVTRKVNPLLKNPYQVLQGSLTSQEAFLRTPGVNQIRNVYNLFIESDKEMSDVMPSMADSYFNYSKRGMRSSYLYRQYQFSKPYSFRNNQLKFKGQFDINKNAMKTLQWHYTTIRPLFNR